MISSVPFYRQAGVELTYLPYSFRNRRCKPFQQDKENPECSREGANALLILENHFDRHLRRFAEQHYGREVCPLPSTPYRDGHCIEVATKPLRTWEELEKAWQEATRIAAAKRAITESKAIISGGGHIHVEADHLLRWKVFRFCANRPWLLWCFNDPSDTEIKSHPLMLSWVNQRSIRLVKDMTAREFHNWRYFSKSTMASMLGSNVWGLYSPAERLTEIDESSYQFYGQKTFAVAPRHETVEFRFFDMANSWDEQRMFMELAQRIVEHVSRKPTEEMRFSKKSQIERLSQERVMQELAQLVRELKLKWKPIRDYALPRLADRFSLGTIC